MRQQISLGRFLAVVALAAIQAACSADGPTVAAGAPRAATGGEQSTDNYIIGPGDALSVFVWRNEDLTTEVQVRPDGKISIPLVEDMPAVDKTPSQLATDIEAVLGEFIRSPDVTVIVTSFGVGAYDNQIRVVGSGAQQPQAIPYRSGLTLLDIMIEVGLSEFAAGDRAKLVRRVNGQLTETPIRLSRLVNRGDLSQNVTLLPGDVLIIPEARF